LQPPQPAPPESLSGLIERVTFFNEENGFAVLKVKAKGHRCRVTIKVGKECANKVGMGLEDWAMEPDDGFGVLVWGVSEVVDVSIGAEAADDGGAG
jgi:hypothetical protein